MQHQRNKSSGPLCVALALALLALTIVGVARPALGAAVTFEDRMLELVNASRAAAGVPPLQLSPTLAAVAADAPFSGCGFPVAGRSTDMGTRNYFSHTILNCAGKGAPDMVAAAGFATNPSENIAWASGLTDPLVAAERLHNDLMSSDMHRANVLNPAFTHLGVGSWHTAAGADWSGGGYALRNVFVATELFITQTTAAGTGGGRYHPLTPSRILDTRSGAPLGPGATVDMQVSGRGGVPSTGVSAVVLNVAVTGPTAAGYLTVFPAGVQMPLASNLNFEAGQTVPNLVTAKVGSGGRLSIFNAAGTTHVIGDVAGWYDDGSVASGSRYHPVTPSRILDTRAAAPLGASATMNLQVAGQGGVPTTGVSAVVMNVAVTGPTSSGYLTVFPSGEAMPATSNLNFAASQTVPNLVTAKLGAGGKLSFYNAAGVVQVIADVAGWFDDGTSAAGGLFHPVTPGRILDTRSGAPVGAGAFDLQVTGRAGVPAAGVSAVVMNMAVTAPTAAGFLTVFPAGEAMPPTANLNFVPGQTVPNLVMAKLGSGGRVSIANAAGTVHVIADVAGWFDAG